MNKKYESTVLSLEERVVLLEAKLQNTEEQLKNCAIKPESVASAETEAADEALTEQEAPEPEAPEQAVSAPTESLEPLDSSADVVEVKQPATLDIPTLALADVPMAYERGRAAYEKASWDEADADFTAIQSQYPDHDLTPNAAYWSGEVAYSRLDFNQALKRFQVVVDLYPKSRKAADGLFKLAKCFEKLGRDEEALATYRKVVELYPDSSVAKLAKEWL